VTSTGQYVIAWDFAKVKKGQMDKYEIKKYEDLVVQDNFRFGDDKEIVRLSIHDQRDCSLIDCFRFRLSHSRIMFLALIRRASASPHGRRSPLNVETRAAALELSMHPTDNDVSLLFLFLHVTYPTTGQGPFTYNAKRNRGCMTTQISPTWKSSCTPNMY
jgi:hypothetical protein